MCKWMDGWMDGEIRYTWGTQEHTQMHTLTSIHLYKADSSSVSFIAPQWSDCNTLAFNHIFASHHKILLCFGG